MPSFSQEWLALREPADRAARTHTQWTAMAQRLQRRPRHRAVDLACGTGANVRFLMTQLPNIRQWTLVDHDRALLDVARTSLTPLAAHLEVELEFVEMDLRFVSRVPIRGAALVTASALLDLVSADWLQALATSCLHEQVDVLFALTYDGRIACEPADPLDELVRTLVNRHQRLDKGFGPALGPTAADVAAQEHFVQWDLLISLSDWVLGAESAELQRQLVEGWAHAAREISPADAREIDAWRARRLRHIDDATSRIRVGHQDLAGWAEPIEITR